MFAHGLLYKYFHAETKACLPFCYLSFSPGLPLLYAATTNGFIRLL